MNLTIEKILSIPKSFYVSLKLCGIKNAFKMPIKVRYNTQICSLRGKVILKKKQSRLSLGFTEISIFDKKMERCILDVKGDIILNGSASFGVGARISVGENGLLDIGNRFQNSAKMTIICTNSISIGDDFLSSWNTFILDSDFHTTKSMSTQKNSIISKPIMIGNNVWMCMNSTILKGVILPEGCIVGASTLVNSGNFEKNSLIVGTSAIVAKKGISRVVES